MLRLDIALLVTSLLVIGTSGTMAQSPSPGPVPLDGRVEVPKAGYAVTFPEGWTVETREVVESTDSPEGSTDETRLMQSYAAAPDGSASCLLIEDRLEESLDDPSATLDETAAYHRSRYEPVLAEMSSIELPLGPAVRFVLDYSDHSDEVAVGAVYLLSDGVGLFILSCLAPEPPDDDWWLSVAETFEFLPAARD